MFKTHRTFELTAGVKNNTIAVFAGSDWARVMYHQTIVFSINRNTGEITLDNGGWDTVSTRAVIGRALVQVGFSLQRNRKKENLIVDSEGKLVAHFEGYLKFKPGKGLAKYTIKLKKAA